MTEPGVPQPDGSVGGRPASICATGDRIEALFDQLRACRADPRTFDQAESCSAW